MAISMHLVQGAMSHGIGGASLSTSLGGVVDLANRAATVLTSWYPWRFMRRVANLSLTSGQEYVVLPTRLAELERVSGSQPLGIYVELSTLAEVVRWRASILQVAASRRFLAALSYADDPNGAEPIPRLELYPTPGSNETDAFQALYRTGWVDLDDDADSVPLPWYVQELYLQVCRELAKGYEGDTLDATTPLVTDRLDRLRSSSLFSDAADQDTRAQMNIGPSTGGWMHVTRLYRDLDTGGTLSVT